jgi:hypothetical protein
VSERERQGRDASPLWVEPEEMRRIGYRTVDMLVDGLADAAQRAPLRVASPEEMRRRLDGAPPAQAQDYDAILAELEEHVLPFTAHWGLNHTTAAVDVERVIDWLEAAEVAPADAVDAVEVVAPVLSSEVLNALRREVPEVAERMRAAVQERLPG